MRCFHYVVKDQAGNRLASGTTTSLELARHLLGPLQEVTSKDATVRRFVDGRGNTVLIGEN